uniref:Uncharacterized protein n=1 Tax=Tanacetum cinerariifolium TaxID=118510 RepID=A0A699GZ12_TANCI|nr:hypothetical protein [Tanacetum cinerariifolium]
MERGFLSSETNDKNKNDETKEQQFPLLSRIAKCVKNIDGKIMGKDGKPLKAVRVVRFVPVTDSMMAVNKTCQVENLGNTPAANISKKGRDGETYDEPAVTTRLNFRTFVNEERVENHDTVLRKEAIDKFTSSKWTPNACLKRKEVTTVPVWVKLYNVPVVAYLEDGLSLIATQIGTPIMLDDFTSSIMAIPIVNGIGHTREVIRVEYEWKPSKCIECKTFGHDSTQCLKRVNVTSNATSEVDNVTNVEVEEEGFTVVKGRKNKGKKVTNQQSKN